MNENEMTAYVRAFASPYTDDMNDKNDTADRGKYVEDVSVDEVLTIDTETSMEVDKSLWYGFALLTGKQDVRRFIIFYDKEQLSELEIVFIKQFARDINLSDIADKLGMNNEDIQERKTGEAMEVGEFVKWMYERMRYNRLLIVGHNLPFDISRLATDWYAPRKGRMAGGFGLVLYGTADKHFYPAIQVKHIGYAKNIWRMEQVHYTKKNGEPGTTYGAYKNVHFVDTQTLAGALLSEPIGLAALGELLRLPEHLRKMERPTTDYRPSQETLSYAAGDVLSTYACYVELQKLYDKHGLSKPVWNMLSGASLGKAYLEDVGIKSFSELHPDFPPEITGYAMNAYYGGRSEINVRLEPSRGVLRDFSGEYPTVCALMHIQDFLLANDIIIDRNASSHVRDILQQSTGDLLAWLHSAVNWQELTTLVKVKPDNDRLPIRANYGDGDTTNIALPYTTSDIPMWFTLSDVIASALLTGKAPQVYDAIRLLPGEEKYETTPIRIMGGDIVDLLQEDFFIRVGDLRLKYKKLVKTAKDEAEKEYYNSIQTALKLLQNSTSYGSLVEVNLSDDTSQEVEAVYYDASGKRCTAFVNRVETPGKFFSPLGAFIPAAGRLMLAIAERLMNDRGLVHGFMDTDSAFIICPSGMDYETEFTPLEQEIGAWFQPLSPYADTSVPLFKLEYSDVWFIGISAKRYCIYRKLEDCAFELVKVSTHGLGAIKKPYPNDANPFDIPLPENGINSSRWVHDMWYQFVKVYETGKSINGGKLYRINDVPVIGEVLSFPFTMKALHQVTLSTPHLLQTYGDIKGARPFNFFVVLPSLWPSMLMAYPTSITRKNKSYTDQELENMAHKELVSELMGKQVPFYTWDEKLEHEILRCDTHEALPDWLAPEHLKTVNQCLDGYFTHPELKSALGNERYVKGVLGVRHVKVTGIKYIGKESDELHMDTYEESNGLLGQFHEQEFKQQEIDTLKRRIRHQGVEAVIKVSGIRKQVIYRLLAGTNPHILTETRLNIALEKLEKMP